MRRRTRNQFINVALFACALLFIGYLNVGGTNKQPLDWTTIRYKPTSSLLPNHRGKCPGLSERGKPALVVSRVNGDDDPAWLESLSFKFHFCTYANDAPLRTNDNILQVPANRGHEAMTYLTFIIDNYKEIPAAGAVFIHGAQRAWHNDHREYDNLSLLLKLNVSSALATTGYHNLRCDWGAGTCETSSGPGSLETKLTALLQPYDKRAVSDAKLPSVFAKLFGGRKPSKKAKLGHSEVLRAQCCAQFVVSRERIWQHRRDEYIALRQWLLDDGAAPKDDRVAGRILSYIWHVLFLPHDGSLSVLDMATGGIHLGKLNVLACPPAEECYCRLYGRCDLEGCHGGHCDGQYILPEDYKVPERLRDVKK